MSLQILKPLGDDTSMDVSYNLSYDELFSRETASDLEGYAKGTVTSFGAVAVDTGKFTGRSAKDKYVVKDDETKDSVWWQEDGSDNRPMTKETFTTLKGICAQQLKGKSLYVMDGYCGANPDTRLKVRLVTEVAWMAHFFKNMFIRPSDEDCKHFEPDWTIYNACKTTCKEYESLGLRSDVFIAFDISEKMTLIGGTWYGGEIKKGIFSMMNYFLPLQGIGSFHCSANKCDKNHSALFFGLSGTGKTTLSTDAHRPLIGDDEHGWDKDGIFNLEGGCYAKTIDLNQEKEPEIYAAIKRDALLENVVVNDEGEIDFHSDEKTQNTRVSYPIYHIENHVKPLSTGGHPKHIIFLTCDAFGVLPPVAKLTTGQAMYQYLSGYTAKVAGTELGVTEPVATFSPCFGGPFLTLHPTQYSKILGDKIVEHDAKAYLVNTGWTGGEYGVGERMNLKLTRHIIDLILSDEIEDFSFTTMPGFNLEIPLSNSKLDSPCLNPRETWADKSAYDQTLNKLAGMFIENFKTYENTEEGKKVKEAGPKILTV